MAIEFICPECGGTLRVRDALVGHRIQCGDCDEVVIVPKRRPRDTDDRDDFGEPRDYRRRDDYRDDRRRADRRRDDSRYDHRPAKSSSRLTLWVGMGLVALICVGVVGIGVWQMNRPANWQPYQSPQGGFAMELPAPPRPDAGERLGVQGQGAVEGTTHRQTGYAVYWRDFPGGRPPGATDDELLAKGVSVVRDAIPNAIVQPGPRIEVSGFAARHLTLLLPDGGTLTVRVVVAETRLYLVYAGGRSTKPGDANVQRFIESFEVTDAKLLGAKKEREDAAERARIAEERRKEDEQRRLEELRIAAEKQRELDAQRQAHAKAIAEENAAFLSPLARAPSAPDAEQFSRGTGDVFTFNFEKPKSDGVWSAGTGDGPGLTAGFIRTARAGPGVRGNAAYLRADSEAARFGRAEAERPLLQKTFANADGYTIGGWVRTRQSGVDVFRVGEEDKPLVVLTLGRATVSGHVRGETRNADLSERWQADDGWHHVALVVTRKNADSTVTLYLDGMPVSSGTATGLPQLPTRATVALGGITVKPGEGATPPGSDGQPGPPAAESLVAAVDECSMITRPLTAAEVLSLAGRAPPPTLLGLKLVAGKNLGAAAFVAIDPVRKVAWVVSSADQLRTPITHETPQPIPAPPAKLRKFSYPEFVLQATFDLPGPVTIGAFDLPRNRLFLNVLEPKGELVASLQEWPAGIGKIKRFDLDTLPEDGKALLPDVESRERFAIGALAASPDGATVYFTGVEARLFEGPRPRPDEFRLYRMGEDLDKPAERFQLLESLSCPRRIELSPDGGTLSLFRPSPKSGGGDLVEVDTAKWQLRAAFKSNVRPGDWVSVDAKRLFVAIGDVKPDVAVSLRVNDVSVWGGIGASGHQFLGRLANGRLLVTSRSDTHYLKKVPVEWNVLRVYDSTGRGAERGKDWPTLAELTETRDVRIGGPFWTSPDGKALVFRSGQVVNVESTGDVAPFAGPLPALVAAKPRLARAPLPRERLWETEVADPLRIAGLKFYLKCDAIEGGKVFDAVSGKAVGQVGIAELIHGPRGQSLRLRTERVDNKPPVPGVSILDPKLLRVPEGKPFTLSVWVRSPDDVPADSNCHVMEGSQNDYNKGSRSLRFTNTDKYAGITLTERPDNKSTNGYLFNGRSIPGEAPTRWTHYALTRDEKNNLHWVMNGSTVVERGEFAAPLDYTEFGFATSRGAKSLVDIDEFCLFDRALTLSEIRSLAGRLPLPPGQSPKIVSMLPKKEFATPRESGVPSASDITGLKFHLAFDEITDGKVRESVSGKLVGKLSAGELVVGQRAKALRVTTKGSSTEAALDLTDQKQAFQIPDKGSFTLCLWVRFAGGKPGASGSVFNGAIVKKGEAAQELAVILQNGAARPTASIYVNDEETQKGTSHPCQTAADNWMHVALMRDGDKPIRVAFNGKLPAEELEVAVPFAFNRIGLMVPFGGEATMDIDELCLFDRVLTKDELSKLAGLKLAPK